MLLTGFLSHRRNGLSVPPPRARLGVGCWEAAGLHRFLLLGRGYKMPLIFPSPQGLKPFHFSLPTLQNSPFLCLSLVPMFTVELSRGEQREMSFSDPLSGPLDFTNTETDCFEVYLVKEWCGTWKTNLCLSCHLFSHFHLLNFLLKLKL